MEQVGAVLTALVGVWLLSVVVSRTLHTTFSVTRRVAAGVVAWSVAVPVITAITPPRLRAGEDNALLLWYTVVGTVLAVLAAMVLLVLAEVFVPSGSVRGPVSFARALPSTVRRTRRYVQVATVLIRRGMAVYVFTRQRPDARGESAERLARALRAALEDSGVTFVKLGQLLATREDLLPAPLVRELSQLQTQARPVPWEQVAEVLAQELGSAPEVVFAWIDPSPLASASIAQVHAATLRSGEDVVVKVQRPGVAAVVRQDLEILDRLARVAERRTVWAAKLGLVRLVHGFGDSLREELDFTLELESTVVATTLAHRRGAAGVGAAGVRLPRTWADLTTPRVFVLERFAGQPVTTARGRDDAADLARDLFDEVLAQVLVDGVFHADPHPGNILLLDEPGSGPRLALIDFGSVGRLDAEQRGALARLLLAIDRRSSAATADALLDIARVPAGLDEQQLREDLGPVLVRASTPGVSFGPRMAADLVRLLARHGLGLPGDVAAVLRTIATVHGTLTALDPGFDVVGRARSFAVERGRERVLAAVQEPDRLVEAVFSELALTLPALRGMPRRVDRLLRDAERGALAVRVRPDDAVDATVGRDGMTALAAATTGVMGVLLVTLGADEVGGELTAHGLIGYPLLLVSAVLGLRSILSAYRRGR